jgi:anti-sigma regulatory factor (Ser/Thr protein kinase)
VGDGVSAQAGARVLFMNSGIKLLLPSDPRYLSVVRGAVERFAALVGFEEEDCRWITLAVHEALTNVIRHAYHNRHDQPIEISCRERDSGIEVVMVDNGQGVRPEQLSGRALDDVKPGGLGTHMIREIMDEMDYAPLEGRNELRLWKKRGSKSDAGE